MRSVGEMCRRSRNPFPGAFITWVQSMRYTAGRPMVIRAPGQTSVRFGLRPNYSFKPLGPPEADLPLQTPPPGLRPTYPFRPLSLVSGRPFRPTPSGPPPGLGPTYFFRPLPLAWGRPTPLGPSTRPQANLPLLPISSQKSRYRSRTQNPIT